MHILFLSDNFPPEVNAPASRTFEHCREWVKAGHRVTVITCAPNFPTGKVFSGYKNTLWQADDTDGIRVIRVWSYITRNEGFFRRILDYLSFMMTATIASLFVRRVDIVVGTSPQFFTSCAAFAVAAVKRRPWIFELRDIWPESIRAVSAMKQSWVLDQLERLELFLYRRSSAIVSVTHAFKENLVRRHIAGEKIHVITNGVDLNRFFPRQKDERLERELGLQGKLVAGYIGTHGLAHALDTLIDAAISLRDHPQGKGIHLLMLGDGAERARLAQRIKASGLDNIMMLDSVPKNEVVRYWSLLDVSIIHLARNELFKTVIPSKIFESMGMGIPLLHGVEGESASIVEDNAAGILFEPENPEDLVRKLIALHQDPEQLQNLSEHGVQAAPRYSREQLAHEMLKILETTARS